LCIWVDAICFNQDDIEERNAQVKLMTRIYSNAEGFVCFDDDARMAQAYHYINASMLAIAYYYHCANAFSHVVVNLGGTPSQITVGVEPLIVKSCTWRK
jgi:hypothetical protein